MHFFTLIFLSVVFVIMTTSESLNGESPETSNKKEESANETTGEQETFVRKSDSCTSFFDKCYAVKSCDRKRQAAQDLCTSHPRLCKSSSCKKAVATFKKDAIGGPYYDCDCKDDHHRCYFIKQEIISIKKCAS